MRMWIWLVLAALSGLSVSWIAFASARAQALTPAAPAVQPPPPKRLDDAQRARASSDYQRYCALCHGADRVGHANDEAPSLRTPSLFRTSHRIAVLDALRYGRQGTAMGGYSSEVGGPLSREDLGALLNWLQEEAGVPQGTQGPPLPALPQGDPAHGGKVYARQCASCHGDAGQGGVGTALRNPAMLALTPDGFLHEAIRYGREGTPMVAFGGTLSDHDIASVLAWMRHDNRGGVVRTARRDAPPPPDSWILNPDGQPPRFTLKDDLYVSAADLRTALAAKPRIVLLDTRVMSMWQAGHIAGAVPMPYYSSRDEVMRHIPRDGTWIVAYCECPRAAAESVVRRLREQGIRNTAVVWEGIGGWVAAGYPTVQGTLENAPPNVLIAKGKGLDNFLQVGAANWRETADGIVADARTGESSGFLVTKKSYDDFDATLEFWASDDANSGVYVRCADGAAPTDKTCYEANIYDQRADPTYGTGALVHVGAVTPGAHRAGGRWNTYRMRLQGDHLQVWFNGVQTVDARDARLAKGPVALQYNAGTIKLRRFSVQPL